MIAFGNDEASKCTTALLAVPAMYSAVLDDSPERNEAKRNNEFEGVRSMVLVIGRYAAWAIYFLW